MTPDHFTDLDAELAVGSHPMAPEHIAALADAGCRAVVNLQSDEDLKGRGLDWSVLWALYTRRGVATTRIPVTDFDPADLARHLDAGVAAVHEHVSAGRKTYVHCNAGLNRSPSVVIGYLVVHRGLSLEAAVAWVSERHMCMPYESVLVTWAKARGLPLTG